MNVLPGTRYLDRMQVSPRRQPSADLGAALKSFRPTRFATLDGTLVSGLKYARGIVTMTWQAWALSALTGP